MDNECERLPPLSYTHALSNDRNSFLLGTGKVRKRLGDGWRIGSARVGVVLCHGVEVAKLLVVKMEVSF